MMLTLEHDGRGSLCDIKVVILDRFIRVIKMKILDFFKFGVARLCRYPLLDI